MTAAAKEHTLKDISERETQTREWYGSTRKHERRLPHATVREGYTTFERSAISSQIPRQRLARTPPMTKARAKTVDATRVEPCLVKKHSSDTLVSLGDCQSFREEKGSCATRKASGPVLASPESGHVANEIVATRTGSNLCKSLQSRRNELRSTVESRAIT